MDSGSAGTKPSTPTKPAPSDTAAVSTPAAVSTEKPSAKLGKEAKMPQKVKVSKKALRQAEQELQRLMNERSSIFLELANLERDIYDQETQYLAFNNASIVTGFSSGLGGGAAALSATAGLGDGGLGGAGDMRKGSSSMSGTSLSGAAVNTSHRIFSSSSKSFLKSKGLQLDALNKKKKPANTFKKDKAALGRDKSMVKATSLNPRSLTNEFLISSGADDTPGTIKKQKKLRFDDDNDDDDDDSLEENRDANDNGNRVGDEGNADAPIVADISDEFNIPSGTNYSSDEANNTSIKSSTPNFKKKSYLTAHNNSEKNLKKRSGSLQITSSQKTKKIKLAIDQL
ncbi:hypothetical protein AYI69_g1796 [Smittium culicis]|uniref:Chromatin modification-related protein EAF6 n=1 Tax=Smittium culicis TaxID=133412 RepID=A0A1R1YPA7_9FUNG|nr:hypothetical protein AYI69_g1796 [Smittium culicis]